MCGPIWILLTGIHPPSVYRNFFDFCFSIFHNHIRKSETLTNSFINRGFFVTITIFFRSIILIKNRLVHQSNVNVCLCEQHHFPITKADEIFHVEFFSCTNVYSTLYDVLYESPFLPFVAHKSALSSTVAITRTEPSC